MRIEKNNLALLGIMLSVLSLSVIVINPLQEANALSYIAITTNGTQTNDNCVSAVDDVNNVWLLCNSATGGANSVLSVVNANNGHQVATLTTSITFSTVNQLLPLYANSQSILLYSRTGFIKYSFDGTSITQTGAFTPSSCTNGLSGSAGYDSKGYVWYSCPTQQTVGAFNPSLMTDVFRSGALTLGAGFPSTCTATGVQDVKTVYTTSTIGLVSVECTNPQDILFFDISNSGGVITQLTHKTDSITLAGTGCSAFPQLYVDGDSKRIFCNDSVNGIKTFTYTISGVTNFINALTAEKSSFGQTGQYNCYTDFYMTSTKGHIAYCAGTNIVEGFYSNSTGVFSTFNIGSYATTYNANIRPIESYNAGVFVVSTGLLDGGTQTFLYMTGTATTYSNPVATPPNNNNVTSTIGGCGSAHCYGDINCDLPANQGYLGCQIALNNSPALKSASQSTASSVNFLLGQVGLVNSTNTNIKTNGTGYILTGVVMGIMVAVFWLASGGEINKIPTFLWFLATLGVMGLSVAFGWIDTTFFIIAILAIIALASTRVIQQLELGGFK